MGDMADFALEHTIEEEMYRADAYMAPIGSNMWIEFQEEYGFDPQPPIPELDLGLFTREELDQRIAADTSALDQYYLQKHHAPVVPAGYWQKKYDPVALQAKCKKHSVAWSMRAGMAKAVRQFGTLSIKQHKWMETNYKGGSDKFIKDMTDPLIMDQLAFLIYRFNFWVQDVANGQNATVAWKEAEKKAKHDL